MEGLIAIPESNKPSPLVVLIQFFNPDHAILNLIKNNPKIKSLILATPAYLRKKLFLICQQ